MLVLPAPVCLAADTSPLDGFRALVCFLSWFANRPALNELKQVQGLLARRNHWRGPPGAPSFVLGW